MNSTTLQFSDLPEILDRCRQEIRKVIIGQDRAVDLALICVFTGHHALVEGVPGVAKTLLVRTLAAVLGGEFKRIQFTPDLMPADITGVNLYDPVTREFRLQKGPIFTTFLLGDEINRAPAKTQSALLEAMQERGVTIDRDTYALPQTFTVFATQNPIEFEGTYPLPEAQKDRFMLKIPMDYPSRESELVLAQRELGRESPEAVLQHGQVQTVMEASQLLELRHLFEAVLVREELVAYIVDLVRYSREEDSIMIGAGPRATQALLLASRAQAALAGRDFVTPDDVKSMAVPVLAHRLIIRPEYEIEGLTLTEVVGGILREVSVPR